MEYIEAQIGVSSRCRVAGRRPTQREPSCSRAEPQPSRAASPAKPIKPKPSQPSRAEPSRCIDARPTGEGCAAPHVTRTRHRVHFSPARVDVCGLRAASCASAGWHTSGGLQDGLRMAGGAAPRLTNSIFCGLIRGCCGDDCRVHQCAMRAYVHWLPHESCVLQCWVESINITQLP